MKRSNKGQFVKGGRRGPSPRAAARGRRSAAAKRSGAFYVNSDMHTF